MSADQGVQEVSASPDVQQGAPRAVPRGLEAYPSLVEAFAAPQPRNRYGLQTHGSVVEPRMVVKTPTNKAPYDTPLPKYQHETDNALAVDVGVLWRALSHSNVPEHAPYTLEKCKFNHEVDYQGDAALVAKLRTLPDFPALKAFLVDVLVPPPRPPKQPSGLKRKSIGGDWPDRKRLYKGRGDLFEKLLTRDNLKGYGAAERLCLPLAAMKAEPFGWEPADPASREPPTILLSCKELGVTDVDATLGKRTVDGYRMGKGTQGLLKKLKAKPEDIMQLRVTRKEGDTIWVDLQLQRHQKVAAAGGSTGGTPAASGAATGGGSMGHNPSTSNAAAAAKGAGELAGPAESASPPREVSRSDFGSDLEEDEDDEVQIVGGTQRLTGAGEQQSLAGRMAGQPAAGHKLSQVASERIDGAVAAAQQVQQQRQHAQQQAQQQPAAAQQQAQQQAAAAQQQAQQTSQQQEAMAGGPSPQQQQTGGSGGNVLGSGADAAGGAAEQQRQQRAAEAQQQQQQQQAAEERQQQQWRHPTEGQPGGTRSGAGAAPDSSHPAMSRLAERVLQQRLAHAVEDLGAAGDDEQRLRPLLLLAAAGHGGALLQEILRRWAQLSEESRELVAIAVAVMGQEPMQQQLRRALNTAGEDWHASIVDASSGDGAAEQTPSPAELTCRRRAAAACEEAAALLTTGQAATSQQLRRPLGWLAVANIGGAPVREADDGWAGFSPAQQRRLFEDILVAVHQGAWKQLEARMRTSLMLLPHSSTGD